jgi:hypothetical protein
MFETLEDAFEKYQRPVDRGDPIVLYSLYVVFSSIALLFGVGGHGFLRLFRLVDCAAMFLLSLTWLVASLRSSARITRRDFSVRWRILLVLLFLAAHLEGIFR